VEAVVLVVVVSESRLLVCVTAAGPTRHSSERMGEALAVCDIIDLFISFECGWVLLIFSSLVFLFY
jgi:hypothetical protein